MNRVKLFKHIPQKSALQIAGTTIGLRHAEAMDAARLAGAHRTGMDIYSAETHPTYAIQNNLIRVEE